MSKALWKLCKFQGRSASSTGLQNQHTGYSYNVAGGVPPNFSHRVHSPFTLSIIPHDTWRMVSFTDES